MSLSNKLTWVAVGGIAAVSSYVLYQKFLSGGNVKVEDQQKRPKEQSQEPQKVMPSPSKSPAAKLTDDQYYVFIVESLGIASKSVSRNLFLDETTIKRVHASLELLQRFSVFTDHNQKYKDNQIIPLLVSLLKDIVTQRTLFGADVESVADKTSFVLSNICLTDFFDELFLQYCVLEVLTTASASTKIFYSLLQTILNISSRTSDTSRQIIKQSNAMKTVVNELKLQLQPQQATTSVLHSSSQNTDPKEKQKRLLLVSKILVNFSLDDEYTTELFNVEPAIMESVVKLSKYFIADIAERGLVVKNNLQSFLAKP